MIDLCLCWHSCSVKSCDMAIDAWSVARVVAAVAAVGASSLPFLAVTFVLSVLEQGFCFSTAL
jgi:hypothetical protein